MAARKLYMCLICVAINNANWDLGAISVSTVGISGCKTVIQQWWLKLGVNISPWGHLWAEYVNLKYEK